MPKRKRKNDGGSKKKVKFKGVIKIGERFRAYINILMANKQTKTKTLFWL